MKEHKNTRLLPVGMQSFEKIRRGGYVYVDKTDFVWKIANEKQNNFLSRPRRFGKSLLTSTLKCYFEGKRDLFEGLKIMDLEKEWKPCQVFHFDFSGKNNGEQLKSHLEGKILDYEDLLGKSNYTNLNDRLVELMKKGAAKYAAPVAVLVDEYDAPLQHTLFDKEEHDRVRDVYTSFFPALKTGEDYLNCLFLTGITKFTQLSIFSTLNNVSFLGSWPDYATVCGITREEIEEYFMPELENISKTRNIAVEDVLDELQAMYDGYHFTSELDKGVYNPYSLVNALDRGRISNYWASSGGSSLLSQMLEHTQVNGDELDGMIMDAETLENADVNTSNIPLFLYQTGYLTIKDYDDGDYTLGFPNEEVKRALFKIVLPNALDKQEGDFDNSIGRMRRALKEGNVQEAMNNLQQLVSETPYAMKGFHHQEFSFLVRMSCGRRKANGYGTNRLGGAFPQYYYGDGTQT
jgi:hypothetical protein